MWYLHYLIQFWSHVTIIFIFLTIIYDTFTYDTFTNVGWLPVLEHSNSGKKVSIRFDSRYRIEIRQFDKFAASTLIFK